MYLIACKIFFLSTFFHNNLNDVDNIVFTYSTHTCTVKYLVIYILYYMESNEFGNSLMLIIILKAWNNLWIFQFLANQMNTLSNVLDVNRSTFLTLVTWSFRFAWFGFCLGFFFFLKEGLIRDFRRPPAGFLNNILKACLFKCATTCPYLCQAF